MLSAEGLTLTTSCSICRCVGVPSSVAGVMGPPSASMSSGVIWVTGISCMPCDCLTSACAASCRQDGWCWSVFFIGSFFGKCAAKVVPRWGRALLKASKPGIPEFVRGFLLFSVGRHPGNGNPCKLIFAGVSLVFAEREGFEPTTLTAYISATSLSKFQIGNETVTIFRCWACPTLTAVCLPNFRVQRYGFLLKLANI